MAEKPAQSKIPDKYSSQFGEEFELQLLSILLRVPSALMQYRDAFRHTFFSTDLMRVIARELFKHADQYKNVPSRATIIENVRQQIDERTFESAQKLLKKLYKRDISDQQSVLDRAVSFAKTAAMVEAVLKSVDEINNGQPDKVRQHVEEAESVGEGVQVDSLGYVSSIEERIQRYIEGEIDRSGKAITTGMMHLDEVMRGGLCPGEIATLLAPPKFGKSTFLINIGAGAMSNGPYNVVHITNELSKDATEQRYDSWFVRNSIQLREHDRERFTRVLRNRVLGQAQGELFVIEYAPRRHTPSTIRAKLHSLAAAGVPPHVIIIDYADRMQSDSRETEERFRVKTIYEDLKSVGSEFNCPVWTASQIKRSAVEAMAQTQRDTYQMEDVAEAYEKVASADAIFTLNQTPEERRRGISRIFTAGARDFESDQTVVCDINRKQSLLQSKVLFLGTGEHYDMGEDPNEVARYQQRQSKQKAKNSKGSGGSAPRKRIRDTS